MIIGNGDIGSVLKEIDREDVTFFASGISNSQETDEKEYKREHDLLLNQAHTKHLVYFSTLAIFYSDTRYTQHKLQMESLVKRYFVSYTIVRIGNITWGDNPHTIINFFKNKIAKGEKVEIKDENRYLVDKDEFLHWLRLIKVGENFEMNITGKRMKVAELVERLTKYGHP